MPSSTSPRIPLERAQYFLARAERLTATERREFDNDLQAAVVFGRSVYHYLQSLAAPANADAGYRAWFRSKKTTLAADPVLEYSAENATSPSRRGRRAYSVVCP